MKRSIWMFTALVCVLGGCASAQITTPTGFAAHDEGNTYDFRASDGEGVVIAVRTEKNRPHGDLLYWSSALDVQLRKSGYEPFDATDVSSADGHDGKQLRYVLHENGRDMVFWLSVFVTDRQVVVVEVAGDSAFFDPKTDQVEAAIASLTVG